MTQKLHQEQNRFSVIAFFIYLAIFSAPNGKLFSVKVYAGLHLTPVRSFMLILGIITTVHLLTNKLNIVPIVRKFSLFLPLILLLTFKIVSLLYSSNYLGGIAMIEWFVECIFCTTLCYFYYIRGVINLPNVLLFISAGLALNLFVAFLQIATYCFRFNYLSSIIDYVEKNTLRPNLHWITGLSSGDVNCYASYIAGMLIIQLTIFLYSKKHILGSAILFFACCITLYAGQSRTTVIALSVVLIYFSIMEKAAFKRKMHLLLFVSIPLAMCLLSSEYMHTFIARYSVRYTKLFYYATGDKFAKETSVDGHLYMLQIYNEIIDREPLAVLIGCGEGDYLSRGGDGERGKTGAHNAYALILGENGPIALLLFIYITWLILKVSVFVNKNSTKPAAKSFLYFNLTYILSFVLYGSQIHAYIFWMIVGLTFAEKTRIDMGTQTVRAAQKYGTF